MTQFGGIRKMPYLGFMIRKTVLQTVRPGPGLKPPRPPTGAAG